MMIHFHMEKETEEAESPCLTLPCNVGVAVKGLGCDVKREKKKGGGEIICLAASFFAAPPEELEGCVRTMEMFLGDIFGAS